MRTPGRRVIRRQIQMSLFFHLSGRPYPATFCPTSTVVTNVKALSDAWPDLKFFAASSQIGSPASPMRFSDPESVTGDFFPSQGTPAEEMTQLTVRVSSRTQRTSVNRHCVELARLPLLLRSEGHVVRVECVCASDMCQWCDPTAGGRHDGTVGFNREVR